MYATPESLAVSLAGRLNLPLVDPDGVEIARGFVRPITRELIHFQTTEQILGSLRETIMYLPEMAYGMPAVISPTWPTGMGMWWQAPPPSRPDLFVILYLYVVTRLRRNQYGPTKQGL